MDYRPAESANSKTQKIFEPLISALSRDDLSLRIRMMVQKTTKHTKDGFNMFKLTKSSEQDELHPKSERPLLFINRPEKRQTNVNDRVASK